MDPLIWSLILLALGLGVIFMELFVPSGGFLGLLAGVLIISAIVVAFFKSVLVGAILLAVVCLSAPLLIALLVKFWPSTPIGRRILIGPVSEDEVLPTGDRYAELQTLNGRMGTAKTKMLPSGMVKIDGRSYDAVSNGFAIEPGDPIQVIEIRANRVVVRRVDPSEQATTPSADVDDVLSQSIEQLGLDPIDEPIDRDAEKRGT